ncbi:centromere protein H (CENP-H)-domain-containing protein [Plectosphaerella plurivora]|uniref:Centromere protein H (CENP-H)-domain-containing protein n=1 Tax=Plectosphaerella plurivora TaxID=936078 RepID=A0A9P8V652_9PEZI|nr:centromere protein H (CENP-H)-domain-containing protein [Plectosphaerella plurivora]
MEPPNPPADSLAGGDIPPLQLSHDERRVLDLHDQLRQLEIQIAFLKAQQKFSPDPSIPDTEESVRSAQQAAAKAKAAWLLRNDMTDSVLTANPIIKAVHASKNIIPIESDLLPHIRTRDAVSSTQARNASSLQDTLAETTEAESQVLRASRRNAQLAADLLRLAKEVELRKTGGLDPDDEEAPLREETEAQRRKVKASRQKWKVMKGTVSAMVVGSGVDWVRDPELRKMVLDEEDN